jgi:DNA polymerase III subunit epsilon
MFDNFFHKTKVKTDASVMTSTATQAERWIVLDTETTGLSLWRDRLISIAAVAIHLESDLKVARIRVQDSFEAVIRPAKIKHAKDNILIHHIGVGAQTAGDEQRQVLQDFTDWIGDAPLFAFHAPFDKSMVLNAYKKATLAVPGNQWIDVAPLANWVARDSRRVSLDDRMAQFGLQCIARHQAAGDMFVTAELLLKMLPALRQQARDLKGITRLAREMVPVA